MFEGEDLAGHHPGKGAPGRCKEKDVDANESDACFLCGHIVHDDLASRVLARGQSTAHGHDKLTDTHAHSAPEK